MFRIRPSRTYRISRYKPVYRPLCQARCYAGPGRPKGTTDNWAGDKLTVMDEYPMTATLNERIHPSMLPKKARNQAERNTRKAMSAVHVRTQIVSPDLCDDVLKYIGPSLEKHKGCEILDINPGACLWSQKLHDFLQPRSHVLLEPTPEPFRDFMDPLLNAPDSKYKLVKKDPTSLESYRELVTEGVFPHQTLRNPADPNGQEQNNTLFVTGSLAWDPRLPGMGFDSMAKQVASRFAQAAWTNDLFHAFGPVCMLLWFQHDDINALVTQSMMGMQKANRLLEMAQNVNMVVSAERRARVIGRGSISREPQYEMESVVKALQAARASGVEIPPHRRDYAHALAADIEKLSEGTGITRSRSFLEYLHDQHLTGIVPTGFSQVVAIDNTELEIRLRREHPDLYFPPYLQPPRKDAPKLQYGTHPGAEDMRAFRRIHALATVTMRTKDKIEAIVDAGEEMYLLECKALATPDGPEKDKLVKQIEKLDEAWERDINNLTENYKAAAPAEMDDRLNLRYPPTPRIQWDHRRSEPLTMRDTEVWPRNRLSLISLSPKPRPIVAQYPDFFEWVQDFVFGLYNDPAKSLPQSLEMMQHGLSDIMAGCESLRDPEKGGRMQMKHLRVRMLTEEMIVELVEGYVGWPFKKPGSAHSGYFRLSAQGGRRGVIR